MSRRLILSTFLVLILISSIPCVVLSKEVRIKRIRFEGNKEISSGKLRQAITSQTRPWYALLSRAPLYNEETFLTDLLRVEKFYQREGFLQARVQDYKATYNRDASSVELLIYLEEAEPTMVGAVSVVFEPDSTGRLTAERLLGHLQLKPGKRYREEDLKLDYQRLLQEFANNGYPYVEAKVKPTVNNGSHLVDLEWRVSRGPFCFFGPITYSGNDHVSAGAIRRGLGFSPGQVFQQRKLISAQSQVYRLELFQFVSLKAIDLDARPRQIPIEVQVKESTLRTLKFGLGYGSEEHFRASVQWRHRNFLGGARILRLNGKHAGNLLPLQVELELSQPYFLSNRNDLLIRPFFVWQDEKSFEVRRIGAEVTLNRRLTTHTNVFGTVAVERDTVEVKGLDLAPELEDLFNKSTWRVGFSHNSSDQIFTPTRGLMWTASIEEAGRFLRTPFKYVKLSTEVRRYRRFGRKSVLAARIKGGSMRPIRGSAETPIDERFFAGGNHSVRGWGRQLLGPSQRDSVNTVVPLGGDSVLEGNFEWRRAIFKKFGGAVFLDYGNVWAEWDGFDLTDLRYALGLGLRYNTVIGPVRVDFAWKLNKQPDDEDRFQIHFSIGQAF